MMRGKVVRGSTTPMGYSTLEGGEVRGGGEQWMRDWGSSGESPLLIYCGRETHGPWDTTNSPFIILVSFSSSDML